jgi:hypothetical protein
MLYNGSVGCSDPAHATPSQGDDMTPPSPTVYPEDAFPTHKVCTKCGGDKPLEDFYKHKLGKFGRQGWCKECYYKNDRERSLRYAAELDESLLPPAKVCADANCPLSGVPQPLANFTKDSINRDGKNIRCKFCTRIQSKRWNSNNAEQKREAGRRRRASFSPEEKIIEREKNKIYRDNNREHVREYQRKYRSEHLEQQKEWEKQSRLRRGPKIINAQILRNYHIRKRDKANWTKFAASTCKGRAKSKGLPFNLVADDLLDRSGGELPKVCPIFPHIELDYSAGPDRRLWASVDRIVPSLGYVKGNVWIVSMAANTWKTNGSNPAERARIVSLMKGKDKPIKDVPQMDLFG